MKTYLIFLKNEEIKFEKIIEVKSKGLLNIVLKELYKIYPKKDLYIIEGRNNKKIYNVLEFYDKFENKMIL